MCKFIIEGLINRKSWLLQIPENSFFYHFQTDDKGVFCISLKKRYAMVAEYKEVEAKASTVAMTNIL
nr:unnamed protein product [Callosobruchus chinensis]